jgi:hypothetical protein
MGYKLVIYKKKYLMTDRSDREILLAEYKPSQLDKTQLDQVRATYAFRYCLGMTGNTEKALIVRKGVIVSREDTFPSEAHYQQLNYQSVISHRVTKKWLGSRMPESCVKLLPIWRGKSFEERTDILADMTEKLQEIVLTHGDYHYLYNYLIGQLNRGISPDPFESDNDDRVNHGDEDENNDYNSQEEIELLEGDEDKGEDDEDKSSQDE